MHSYSVIRLDHWKDYKKFVERFSENWAFRGQADATWILSNAIERTGFIQFYEGVEQDLVSEFQRGARNYLSKDETPNHLIEWLALMQHHGAPTRLLDLTRSPFIAAYFAFEISSAREDDCVAIWGVNISHLRDKALELLKPRFEDALQESRNLINEGLFQQIFHRNDQRLVFPVEPFRMNRRYSLQQSVFISTGISHLPLMQQMDFLKDDIEKAVVKIEIPSSDKKEALRDLLQMNLHRASLFPDLDGYALSLRLRYESMKTPEERKYDHHQKQKDSDYPFLP